MRASASAELVPVPGIADRRTTRACGVFGRDDALHQVEAFLAAIATGLSTVTIRGHAGMGRTTLWAYAVGRARDLGHRVLTLRASEDDHQLPGTALTGVLDDEPDTLTIAAVSATPAFDLGRQLLAALRREADRGVVLVAIDDAQWLDPASANALRFAVHRLADEQVGVLCTLLARPMATGLAPGLRYGQQVELGPLPLDALRKVLGRTIATVCRPELLRAYELSGGNPGLALDLVRSWRGNGPARLAQDVIGGPDPAPDTLAVLQALALAGPAPAGVVATGAAVHDFAAAARIAVGAGTIVVGEDLTMRFRDAYAAQAVLGAMNPLDRCVMHARLAVAMADPSVRARHRALATLIPDETVASELEGVAADCAHRAQSGLAAELAAHAVRLTPPSERDAADRRASAEIAHRAAAGETARALELADRLLGRLGPGPRRAQVLAQRVFLDFGESEGYLLQALTCAGDDRGLRAEILDLLGWQYGIYQGRLAEGLEHSRQALELALEVDDQQVAAFAGATLATTLTLSGQPHEELFNEAIERAAAVRLSPLGRWPRIFWARHLLWSGQLDDARRVFRRMQQDALTRGSEFQRPYRLHDLAAVELAAGDLAAARQLATDGIEAARDAGNEQAVVWLAHPLGLTAAQQGDADTADWAARLLDDWGLANDEPPRQAMSEEVLGTLAATHGDWSRALGHFVAMVGRLDAMGYAHPGARPGLSRAVEAATMMGDESLAAAFVARLAAQADAVQAPLVDGLRLAAEGQLALLREQDAVPALTAAVEQLNRLGYRLEAARARLPLARAWLRAGQRSVARATAEHAAAAFGYAGAPAWIAAAQGLQARAGAAPQRGELTPTEVQVATLVAAGRMNREIAGTLFISTSTVEAHLTRIYRKLQLRHRTDLAGWIQARA